MQKFFVLTSVPISLGLPGIIQFKSGYAKNTFYFYLVLAVVVSIFSLTGGFYNPLGFFSFLVCLGVWYVWLVVDAAWCTWQERYPEKVSSVILMALLITCVFHGTIKFRRDILGFEIFRIPSPSMDPTLGVGSYVIANTRFTKNELKRDDVVFFHSPVSPHVYVKRVVGLSEDVLQFSQNCIVSEYYKKCYEQANFSYVNKIVRKDSMFLVGDNPEKSLDSRVWGDVSQDSLIGRYEFTLIR